MADSKITAGLKAALAHANGEAPDTKVTLVRVPADIDVKQIRTGLRMTQEEFARKYCIEITTLRGWEQKRRVPDGPARVLLTVIAREPKAVERALVAA